MDISCITDSPSFLEVLRRPHVHIRNFETLGLGLQKMAFEQTSKEWQLRMFELIELLSALNIQQPAPVSEEASCIAESVAKRENAQPEENKNRRKRKKNRRRRKGNPVIVSE